MTARHAQIAAQAVTLVLAVGVGMLLGGQFCADEPEPLEAEPPDCPPRAPTIVEHCPDEADDEPREIVAEPDPPPRQAESVGDSLPDDEPPTVTPRQRQRLLAWARDHSTQLQGCPRDRGQTYRFAVTLHLDDDGEIDDVHISSDEEMSPSLRTCLTERIGDWSLPSDVPTAQREVVFRLNL